MKALKFSLVAALLLGAQNAHATFDISAFGGFATLNMTQLNDSIDLISATIGGGEGSGVNKDKVLMTGGYYVGVDGGWAVLPNLKVGPRLEYIAGSGKNDLSSGGTYINLNYNANLLMYELGASSDLPFTVKNLSLQGGAYIGYGMASGTFDEKSNISSAISTPVSGGNVVGEINLRGKYQFVPAFSLSLDLGYRFADVPQVNTNKDTFVFGDTGTLSNIYGEGVGLDFSGFNIGLNAGYSF